MATHQPLLDKPKRSLPKTFCLVLSIAAILITPSTFLASFLIKPSSFFNQVCKQALHKETCTAHVSELLAKGSILTTKDVEFSLLHSFLISSTSHILEVMDKAKAIKLWTNCSSDQAALLDCVQLLDFSMDRVQASMAALNNKSTKSPHDAHTWLSSVLTYHVTCLDGLEGSARALMEAELQDLISRAKTCLDIFVSLFPPKSSALLNGDFPSWVKSNDRKLLESLPKDIEANVVVAQDGSGNFKTLNEAVTSAPDNGETRYVILVKKGTYEEHVRIGRTKTNVMIVGEGMKETVITGSLNQVDGASILYSATVASDGDGFMAQDMRIENTAGPRKGQAVALRVNADRSVINRCLIGGFQDTLFTQSNRQFYRDSIIKGTIDFIFGNVAAVLQKCSIIARKPIVGQANMVTAQGRIYPNQNTGTSIQLCRIKPSKNLEPVMGSIPTFLGRPWRSYSRTAIMESYIDKHIDPAGWSVWASDSDPLLKTKTLYYGEYKNHGPGACLRGRVNWTGFHKISKREEAMQFTVAELIHGEEWLRDTGVAFIEGL